MRQVDETVVIRSKLRRLKPFHIRHPIESPSFMSDYLDASWLDNTNRLNRKYQISGVSLSYAKLIAGDRGSKDDMSQPLDGFFYEFETRFHV